MKKLSFVVLLGTVALLMTACSSTGASDMIESFGDQAVPIKQMAFITIPDGSLRDFMGWFAAVCSTIGFLAFGFSVIGNVKEGLWEEVFSLQGSMRWFAIIIVSGMLFGLLELVTLVGQKIWPDELTFTTIRRALGWNVPLLEGGLDAFKADVNPMSITLAVVATISFVMWHVSYNLILLLTLPIAFVKSIASGGNMEHFVSWFERFVPWALSGFLWLIAILFVGAIVENGNTPTNTIMFTNGVYAIVTFAIIGYISFGGKIYSGNKVREKIKESNDHKTAKTVAAVVAGLGAVYAGIPPHLAAQAVGAYAAQNGHNLNQFGGNGNGGGPQGYGGSGPTGTPSRPRTPPPSAPSGTSGPQGPNSWQTVDPHASYVVPPTQSRAQTSQPRNPPHSSGQSGQVQYVVKETVTVNNNGTAHTYRNGDLIRPDKVSQDGLQKGDTTVSWSSVSVKDKRTGEPIETESHRFTTPPRNPTDSVDGQWRPIDPPVSRIILEVDNE